MFAARSLLCLVVLALGACARAVTHRPGEEYLKAIKFEGNKEIGDGTLETGLALRRTETRGRAPDPYTVGLDADRIRGEYLRKGYFDVDVRSRTDRKGDATTVVYAVEEGVRSTTKVEILGLPASEPELAEKVRAALPLIEGAPFDYEKYDLAKDALEHVLEDAGYAYVTLVPQVIADRANHTAIVQLFYTPGPKCTFRPVDIVGVEGPLREAVRNRLQFVAGQPYSTAAIASTQRALYGLGRFSTVRVQPVKEGLNPTVTVKIDVSESARHEVKLGGGFGVDPASYEVRARVGYSIAGWPFPLDTVTLDLRPAYGYLRDTGGFEPRIRALARLERQDVLWTYSKGLVEVGYSYLAVEAYTSFGPRARLGFETPLVTDRLRLRVGWGIERDEFRNIHPAIDDALRSELGLDGPQLVAGYEQAVVADLRDDPIEPRYGAYGELRVVEGTKYAGGEYTYLELVPELRGYLPLGPLVFAARARHGRFLGDVPATARFFGGGSVSQRGFSERRLAPSVSAEIDGTTETVAYGGTALVETGVEMRFPLMTIRTMPLGGVLFLDGGDVTRTAAELDLMNLHWAVGAGLRLKTIVGPVRFDLGYRLNRTGDLEPDPGSKFAFHLSLGEAF